MLAVWIMGDKRGQASGQRRSENVRGRVLCLQQVQKGGKFNFTFSSLFSSL